MMRKLKLNFKSGHSTIIDTDATPEQLLQRIKHDQININPDTLSMIRWGDVEFIEPIDEQKPVEPNLEKKKSIFGL